MEYYYEIIIFTYEHMNIWILTELFITTWSGPVIHQIFTEIYYVENFILDDLERSANKTDKNPHSRNLYSSEERMKVYIKLEIYTYTYMFI